MTRLDLDMAIRQYDPEAVPLGFANWQFHIKGKPALNAAVSINENRLRVSAETGDVFQDRQPWDMLLACNGLPGEVCPAIVPDSRKLTLIAESSLSPDSDISGTLEKSCHSLRSAFDDLASGVLPDLPLEPTEQFPAGLLDIFKESGWPATLRKSGRITVDLDAPGIVRQAELIAAESSLILRTQQALPEYTLPSMDAAALLLLTVNNSIHGARAGVGEDETGVSSRIETLMPIPPEPDQVKDGLCALSVACRMCTRELESLADQNVAEAYLAIRGWHTS